MKTSVEKIIAKHFGIEFAVGQIVIVDIDFAMATDTTAPLTIKSFKEMGGQFVWDPARTVFVIDHSTPSPKEEVSNLHNLIRKFAFEQKIHLYDVGSGICHQLIVENNHVKPGDIVLGADSHTCTYGALGAFALGVGSTDLAGALLTGKTWLKVPETIYINISGALPKGVFAKDIILFLLKMMTSNGASRCAVEYGGEAVLKMGLDERFTICNMTAELGAMTAIVALEEEGHLYSADQGARYNKVVNIDVGNLSPQIAIPHSVDNVFSVTDVKGTIIHQAFLGSCTNGRIEDFRIAAEMLKGKTIASWVRFIVAPSSADVFLKLAEEGFIEVFLNAGAFFITPGCGPCVGSTGGIPADSEAVISTSNRNFKGRMGNSKADIYLASPATVTASAIAGEVTDPREFL